MKTRFLPSRPTSISDELDWMLQSNQVSDDALIEALIRAYYTGIYRLILSTNEDPLFTEWIVEETFVQAASQRARFWGESTLKAWLYSIAISKQDPLPKPEQIPLILRYEHHLSIAEIAFVLGASQESVRLSLHIQRARGFKNVPSGCQAFQRMIEDALDGCLEPADKTNLEQHITGCQDCRLYAHHLEKLGLQIEQAYREAGLQISLDETAHARLVKRIKSRLSEIRKRSTHTLPVKEALLTGVFFMVLVAAAWSARLFSVEPSLTPTPYVYRVYETQVVTVVVTATPPEVFYYRVKLGDTLVSIAEEAACTVQEIVNLNGLAQGESVHSGQLLKIPIKAGTIARINQPTPVPVEPTPWPLPMQASLDDIRLRVAKSSDLWQTLWADVRVLSYGPPGYIGPPVLSLRKQTWISKPSLSLVVSGPEDSSSMDLSYVNGESLYQIGAINNLVYRGLSTNVVDDAALRSLFFESFLLENSSSGRYVNSGYERIADERAIIVDWFNPDGWHELRFWIDPVRGVILGQRRYGGPDHQTVLWDEFVTAIAFDANFPQGFFNPDSYWPRSFAQDYSGKPEAWNNPSPLPGWLPKSGRDPLPPNPAPAGFDLSKSKLTFQWPQAESGLTGIELFADRYSLATIDTGRPIAPPNDWNSTDIFTFLDWLGPSESQRRSPAAAQNPKVSSFPCKRSPDGRLLVFSMAEKLPGFWRAYQAWIDLSVPQQVNRLQINSLECGTSFAIAPDSRHVAYLDLSIGGSCSVYTLDAYTKEVKKLLDFTNTEQGAAVMEALAWSPDGKSLAMLKHSYDPPSWDLLVSDASSGEISYQAAYDPNAGSLPAGAPVNAWGVPFPPEPANLETCIEP